MAGRLVLSHVPERHTEGTELVIVLRVVQVDQLLLNLTQKFLVRQFRVSVP